MSQNAPLQNRFGEGADRRRAGAELLDCVVKARFVCEPYLSHRPALNSEEIFVRWLKSLGVTRDCRSQQLATRRLFVATLLRRR